MINILELSPDNSEDNCTQGEAELFSFDHDLPTTVRDESESSLPTVPYDATSDANVTDKPLLDGLITGPNAHQQIGGPPPTLEPTPPQTSSWTHTDNEGATSASTEVPSNPSNCFSFFELCSGVINFTWLSIPPFIFDYQNTSHQLMNENTDLKGVFYNIIRRAIQFCCRYHDNRGTRLQFNHKAWNKSMLHKNIFRGDANIGLPVYVENDFFDLPGSYAGSLRFIKVLESPGLALIMDKNNAKESSKQVVWRAIANEWPIMLISLLLCAISGICVWALDTTWNADEFPRPFHRGAFDGFWWAFVTMSTVGYGDKAPKSIIARLFCIVWIMIGLTVCSVMTATLTTALASTVGRDVQLVGKKIAVLKGGPAFQEVIKQGGNPTGKSEQNTTTIKPFSLEFTREDGVTSSCEAAHSSKKWRSALWLNAMHSAFDSFDDMHKALVHTKTVSGILDEMYSGLHHMEQISDSRLYVAKVIQRVRSYGFAFKEGEPFAWLVEECIRNLILYRSEDVYTLMKEYMDGIEEKLPDAMGDGDVIVLGGNSPAFRSIVIFLTIFLGALIGAVLLYEMVVFFYQRAIIKNRTEDIESAGVSNANYGASVRSVSEQEMGL